MNKNQEHHNDYPLEYDEGKDPIIQGMMKELDQVQSSLDKANMIREIAQNPDPRD